MDGDIKIAGVVAEILLYYFAVEQEEADRVNRWRVVTTTMTTLAPS
jgi:hypothetical protein